MLFGVDCVLLAVCCALCKVCCLLSDVGCFVFAVCHLLFWRVLLVVCCL